MPVPGRRRAEPVRVEVDRRQAGGDGAGHVVAEAVADMQDGAARGDAERVQRDAENGRIRLGRADHRGVDHDAHPDPGVGRVAAADLLSVGRVAAAGLLSVGRVAAAGLLSVRRVADTQLAQLGLHRAVGVRDHAHRQAERGQGPQAASGAGADVRPGVAPGHLGDLQGHLAASLLRYAAGGDVPGEVVAPPGGRGGRRGGQVLDYHRPVVGLLERGHVREHPGGEQRRQQKAGLREDQDPARVEQDRADPVVHTRTIRSGRRPDASGDRVFSTRRARRWPGRR